MLECGAGLWNPERARCLATIWQKREDEIKKQIVRKRAALPALLTSMLMARSVRRRCWTHCRTEASEARSSDTTTTWPAPSTSFVSRRMWSAASSAFFRSRHAMITRAPAVGNRQEEQVSFGQKRMGSCTQFGEYGFSNCDLCNFIFLIDLWCINIEINVVEYFRTQKCTIKPENNSRGCNFLRNWSIFGLLHWNSM
jgi:hypothetical protein